ncbi:MAG: citrate transporter [Elusimicrobia bacterium RIFOXYD2_FULL_34_15]|nr:MAG: citrate transporter [Elusimicrobia bacterium RIFOXYD2_FULL_34_15]
MTSPQILASLIFILMFIAIIAEKWHRYISALAGAFLTIILVLKNKEAISWVLNLKEIFRPNFWIIKGMQDEHSHGINWQTIIFIAGMMVMVEGLARVGFFRWLCLFIAKLVNYKIIPIFISFMIISGFLSMFIDSITVLLFISSVTIEIARLLKFDPVPVIIAEIFAANVGGSATMSGDPPNIIIGTSFGFTFFDFLKNTGVIAWICMIFTIGFFYYSFKKQLSVKQQKIGKYPEPKGAITHKELFTTYTILFIVIVVLIVTHGWTGLTVAFIGCIAAVLTLLFAYKSYSKTIRRIDWKTLLFFIGLFICVGGLEYTGVLKILADWIGNVSKGNGFLMVSIILWTSAFASAIVDNIPFAATMVPVIFNLSQNGVPLQTLSWSLALGTDIGGNGTPIGASANVVGIAIAEKKGYKVGWIRYCKYAMPAMIIVVALCNLYLYIRYF